MPPADRPAITAPGARPGSTQTVLTAPAAKVLLGTRDRHLHANWPGRGRGLRGGGRSWEQGSPGAERGGVQWREPWESGKAEQAAAEPPGRIGPAGTGSWKSRGLRREGRNAGGGTSAEIRIRGPWRGEEEGEMGDGKGRGRSSEDRDLGTRAGGGREMPPQPKPQRDR